MSMFFSSMSGVRQGENLSPILFSLFLKDRVQIMSNSYNGLFTLSEDIGSIFNNDVIEVFSNYSYYCMQMTRLFLQSRLKYYKLP